MAVPLDTMQAQYSEQSGLLTNNATDSKLSPVLLHALNGDCDCMMHVYYVVCGMNSTKLPHG